MRRVVGVALLAAIGCAHPPPPVARAAELVWVAKHYAGGVSCRADIQYQVPNTVAILRRSGIIVYASVREGLMLPDSCDAPGYAAIHYALIAERHVERAARAGYLPRLPPREVLPDSLKPSTGGEP